MLLDKDGISLKEFYEKFGGQRQRGICTPRNKPYIYLFISLNSLYKETNDDPNSNPEYLRYAFENNNLNSSGNLAILNHAKFVLKKEIISKKNKNSTKLNYGESEEGIYKSLLVFLLKDGWIYPIGEYERVDLDENVPEEYRNQGVKDDEGNLKYGVIKNDNGKDKYFFLLKRVKDLDDVELKLIISNNNQKNGFLVEKIGTRADYNFLDEKTNFDECYELLSENYDQYTFLDEKNQIVDLDEDSYEARKANQYIFSIYGLHNELKRNNKNSNNQSSGAKSCIDNYIPKLSPDPGYENAFFYIVNVGWGLMQLLVFEYMDNKKEVWAFDCGRQNVNFEDNILACLKEIYGNDATEYGLSKLFISHPHEDHFNAYSYFHMDKNTEVWINPNIRFCTNMYYEFLLHIYHKKCKVIEPVTEVNASEGVDSVINIMHPEGHIVLDKCGSKLKNNSSIISYVPITRKVLYTVNEKEMNELSPIISLRVFNKEIVVVGDVMSKGWKCFIDGRTNGSISITPDVYVHSHHGTSSGYEINYISINNEHDLFNKIRFEFISTNNGYRKWVIDDELAKRKEIYRTDDISKEVIKYYRYDILNDVVDTDLTLKKKRVFITRILSSVDGDGR